MKVTNGQVHSLTPQLAEVLEDYRRMRAFDPVFYVKQKVQLINEYFTRSGLDSAVVGLSGGIDSGLAYALLRYAQAEPHSPLKKVVPLLVPAFGEEGATRQEDGVRTAREICTVFNDEPFIVQDFSSIVNSMVNNLASTLSKEADPWVRGQIVSYARTPLFYGATSFLTAAGYRPLLAGTTNLTEYGYLGFFGKASDAMVDLQIIADIYKSEVYSTAQYLNLPQSALEAVPSGDLFDGRTDEELFGATYDFVEFYYHWLQDGKKETVSEMPGFKESASHLEHLHAHNAHKYVVGQSSVLLNCFPCNIPGGLTAGVWT